MISTLAVAGYRSLRDVVVPLRGLDVVTGANGSGKSSLYRALRLLGDCGAGRIVGSLAREGGLQSALWAGPEEVSGYRRSGRSVQGTVRRGPVSMRLGFSSADGFGYLVDLGLPTSTGSSAFNLDPQIKREVVWSGPVARPASVLVERKGPHVRVRQGRGWNDLDATLNPWESMLTEVADHTHTPELVAVRNEIRSWRFYDGFRADPDAPARQAQIGTRTMVLDHEGTDLAAALQTIIEIGDRPALDRTVSDAFEGSHLDVDVSAGRFDLLLSQPGMLRPLRSAELSDGTLRYLLLAAALLSPRRPGLLVLNEPETSLHPDLLPPLARMVAGAADETQLVVVSHSRVLRDALDVEAAGQVHGIRLVKDLGETRVKGQGRLEAPSWHWGSR